jgi:hypothetical protein
MIDLTDQGAGGRRQADAGGHVCYVGVRDIQYRVGR